MPAPQDDPSQVLQRRTWLQEAAQGEIVVTGKRSATLTLATSPSVPAGRWRAALCDAKGVQMGHIEIML